MSYFKKNYNVLYDFFFYLQMAVELDILMHQEVDG